MLRQLFGEPRRVDEGLISQVNEAIEQFCRTVRHTKDGMEQPSSKFYRLELYAHGFRTSLNELEQSIYCSKKYSERITKTYEEEMSQQEIDDYHRFLYYYKNSFIRIFSILDKVGYFINDLFDLHTEKIKPRFSYFTALRRMRNHPVYGDLEQHLFEIKIKHQDAMNRLRNRRNMEIHHINVEMLDDLEQVKHAFLAHSHIENLSQHLADLDEGYEMVCHSLYTVLGGWKHGKAT